MGSGNLTSGGDDVKLPTRPNRGQATDINPGIFTGGLGESYKVAGSKPFDFFAAASGPPRKAVFITEHPFVDVRGPPP
jgi:hypothetical protein